MLDAFLADDFQTSPAEVAVYRTLAVRDLPAIVDLVVPEGSWDAVINGGSTKQVRGSLVVSDSRRFSPLGNQNIFSIKLF